MVVEVDTRLTEGAPKALYVDLVALVKRVDVMENVQAFIKFKMQNRLDELNERAEPNRVDDTKGNDVPIEMKSEPAYNVDAVHQNMLRIADRLHLDFLENDMLWNKVSRIEAVARVSSEIIASLMFKAVYAGVGFKELCSFMDEIVKEFGGPDALT